MKTVKTTCRICNTCGFKLDIEDNNIVSYKNDVNHPVSEGYICPKGIAGIELQQGKSSRTTLTYRKDGAGKHQAIDAEQAAREVGQKLAAIIKEHGPRSVALFFWYRRLYEYAGQYIQQSLAACYRF